LAKKNRQAFGWRFLGFGLVSSLAGPFRQQAGEIEKAEKPERGAERHRRH
jgi:hypothetical protein